MRIIAESTLKGYTEKKKYAAAKGELALWIRVTDKAIWHQLLDVQKDYTQAEAVWVRKETYTVFNICHNEFRLITMINYPKKIVWVKNFLTHAEYNADRWCARLATEQQEREALQKRFRRSK